MVIKFSQTDTFSWQNTSFTSFPYENVAFCKRKKH